MPVQRPYNPNAKLMAEMMQADLQKVGIDAKIVTYRVGRVPEASRRTASTTMGLLLGWTGDNGDPDNFLNPAAVLRPATDGGKRRPLVRQADFTT